VDLEGPVYPLWVAIDVHMRYLEEPPSNQVVGPEKIRGSSRASQLEAYSILRKLFLALVVVTRVVFPEAVRK